MKRTIRLFAVFAVLFLAYVSVFIWPTRWRYDHLGLTPIRTDRVTGIMQFCNLHGWQYQLPPLGEEITLQPPPPAAPEPTPTPKAQELSERRAWERRS